MSNRTIVNLGITLLLFSKTGLSLNPCVYDSDCGIKQTCNYHICSCEIGYQWNGTSCFKDCRHGSWNVDTDTCECDPHYKEAGITNTIQWLEGKCSQYQCESSALCQELTNYPDASCPVKGWNCYCGLNPSHVGRNFKNATCMSGVYAYSFWTLHTYLYLIKHIWIPFLGLAFISIPFGTRRVRCDHQSRYYKWYFKQFSTRREVCHGECIYQNKLRLRDEFSLSLYWIHSFVWWGLFLTTIEIINFTLWSLILWIIILVGLIMLVCMAIMGKCEDSCGDQPDCCVCCDGNGDCCVSSTVQNGNNTYNTYNIVLIGGPTPDPCCLGCECCSGECCCCSPCVLCCNILRAFIKTYPSLPHNLHGGIVGYCLGTHHRRNTYLGGSACIDFLSLAWMHRTDLRNNEEWGKHVRAAIHEQSSFSSAEQDDYTCILDTPISYTMDRGRPRSRSNSLSDSITNPLDPLSEYDSIELSDSDPIQASFSRIGNVNIRTEHVEWDPKIEGRLFNEDDYINKQCWICMDAEDSRIPGKDSWDVWWNCKHAFCTSCSEEMLRKGWPCPLCRKHTTLVKRFTRGKKSYL